MILECTHVEKIKKRVNLVGIKTDDTVINCIIENDVSFPSRFIEADLVKCDDHYVIKSYTNLYHMDRFYKILDKAIYKEEILKILPEEFMTHPGGKKMHHVEKYGLVIHSIEVAEIAYSICKTMKLDERLTGLAVAGSIIHDIGKCKEIRVNDSGIYEASKIAKNFGWSSFAHLYLGIEMIPDYFPEKDFFKNVILSHHGPYGHVQPASIPAQIVHFADMASSGINGMNNLLHNNDEAISRDGNKFYKV